MGIRTARLALAVVAALLPATTAPAERWEQWRALPGVFDVVGPRRDGQLVAAGAGRLYLVSPTGDVTPFAGAYRTDPAFENYLALSPGPAASPACPFPADEVYALEMMAPLRIVRITADGSRRRSPPCPGRSSWPASPSTRWDGSVAACSSRPGWPAEAGGPRCSPSTAGAR